MARLKCNCNIKYVINIIGLVKITWCNSCLWNDIEYLKCDHVFDRFIKLILDNGQFQIRKYCSKCKLLYGTAIKYDPSIIYEEKTKQPLCNPIKTHLKVK